MVPNPTSLEALTRDLRQRPFRSQLQILDACILNQQAPTVLLEATAQLRDHEPLAYLTRQLGKNGRLTGDGVRESLTKLFTEIPETGAHRILRGLERAPLQDDQRKVVVDAVVQATLAMDLPRLALLCLMDRWLKNIAPEARKKLTDDAIATCERALEEDRWEPVTDPVLLRVPGRALTRLRERAQSLQRLDAWQQRLSAFSEQVLEILSRSPKSLSQANAEDILARRVYTDPGHFLIELLQNAEDASAKSWDARISKDEIRIWHDGTPFDARDVVGVLSIGQTTKKKDQIGFFGVGFKSVYEVCERPQIYSEFFRFEVADVSIPRRLGARPEDFPDHGTLIVLPLRNPDDPKRSAEQLYKKALEVPGQTLLTLPNLQSLRIAKDELSRTVEQKPGPREGTARLVYAEQQKEELYLVEQDDFVFHQSRESSKANHTPILIAIRLDSSGHLKSGDPELPTIFSYLPTGERSGLRFILHAHFDVPVDRERLDLSSQWNRWALRHAGTLLSRLIRRVLETKADLPVLESILDILPLDRELGHPAYATILEELSKDCAELPFLPGAHGEALSPKQSLLITDPSLRSVLSGQALNPLGQRALKDLSPRSMAVARALGVGEFSLKDAWTLIQATAETLIEGQDCPHPWLCSPELWSSIAKVASDHDLEELSDKAVLIDSHGKLFSPRSLRRAKGALRGFYQGVRVLLNESLDSEALQPLWQAMGLESLGARELVEDLAKEDLRGEWRQRGIIDEILVYLSHRPLEWTATLGTLPVFADETGSLHSLKTEGFDGQLWLRPSGRLGQFLESQELALPLISRELQELLGETLFHWGGQSLDVLTLLDVIEQGEDPWPLSTIFEFHRCLNDLRADLTVRMARRLRALALFPDHHGELGPLEGDDPTLIPSDSAIQELLSHCRWIHGDIAQLPYLSQLGVQKIDGKTVAKALLLERTDLLDPFNDVDLRAAYRYLAAHPRAILGNENIEQRLIDAPIWFDQKGQRQRLTDLRAWPETEALQVFYQSWQPFPLIEMDHPEERSTMELVRALRYDMRLTQCSSERLIADLTESQDQIESMDRSLLLGAIEEACRTLSRKQLLPLASLAIFRSQQGELSSLEAWEQESWTGCRIPSNAHRSWLLQLGQRVLSESDQKDWAALIQALKFPASTLFNLIEIFEKLPEEQQSEHSSGLRALLVEGKDQLKAAPQGQSWELWRGRLSELRIWPADDGRKRARDVIRRSKLGELHQEILNYWDFQGYLLSSEAEVDAAALDSLMYFKDPGDYLHQQLQSKAKVGQPLSSQSGFLASREALIATVSLLSAHLPVEELRKLPLAVDISENLVKGPLFLASEIEQDLLSGHSILKKLADRDWAEACQKSVSGFVEKLPAQRFLEAVGERAPKAIAVSENSFFQEKRRLQFYQWLWERRGEIEKEAHARGVLKRCAVFLTPGGYLRAPKELLFETDLPDLGIDWSLAAELPEELLSWLRGQFSPSDALLDRILPFLLKAHEDAATEKDGERSAELLLYLARVLRVKESSAEELERLTRQYKIHRRIRLQVQGQDRFRKPNQLLFPPIDGLPGLESFWKSPPERVHDRYQHEDIRAFVLALGARDDLSLEDTRRLLKAEERHEGPEAQLGFARCMGRVIARRPKALEELRGTAWIPDRHGEPRRPEDLYWPSPELEALIGYQGKLYPHGEFVYTLPEAARKKLPFLSDKDLRMKDLAAHLRELGEPASNLVLDWLEDGLKEKRVEAQDAREHLGLLAIFVDAHGERRSAAALIREDARGIFGQRRAYWPEGVRYPRITAAMQIPSLGRRALLEYHQEMLEDCERLGDGIFETDPKLTETYPQFLFELAKTGASIKGPLLILTQNGEGRFEMTPSSSESLAFFSPESLAEAALNAELPIRNPCLRDDPEGLVKSYLEAHGVGDLSALWKPEPYPEELLGELGGQYAKEKKDLLEQIEELKRALPTLRRSLPLSKKIWGRSEDEGPKSVHVVKGLHRAGSMLGKELEWSCLGDIDGQRKRLILTEDELLHPQETPGLLCRGWLTPGKEPTLLRDIVSDFILDHWKAEDLESLLSQYGVEVRATEKKEAKKDKAPAPVAKKEQSEDPSIVEDEEKEEEGAWKKLSRWLWGSSDKDKEAEKPKPKREDRAPRPRREKPPKRSREPSPMSSGRDSEDDRDEREWRPPPTHKNWFRPRESVQQQLRDHSQQQRDSQNPPSYGFAFAPAQLPVPQLYAPGVIGTAFESRGQRWRAERMPGEWWRGHEEEGFRSSFSGRVPKGESTLPLPLYARLGAVEAGSDARLIQRPGQLPVLIMREDRDIQYEVIFDRLPDFQGDWGWPKLPSSLRTQTVPDKELPSEVLFFIERLRAKSLSPWHLSIAARDFIKKNYVYDPAYLEDPSIARWLAQVSRGRSNAHLAALHAGRDSRHLGRGVCYELNVLAVEILRRLGVPAAAATGWTFDRGFVSEPDHLWALALLPTELGPRWWPIDASTTREGRPLHGFQRPAPRWRARKKRQRARLPQEPKWSQEAPQSLDLNQQEYRVPLGELTRVLRYMHREMGEKKVDEAKLQKRVRELFAQPEKMKELLRFLEGE